MGAHRMGCFRLPGYLKALKSGKVNGRAAPSVERIAPSVLRVDGDRGFAPIAHERGRAPLIELAREAGLAAQPIVRAHHFSALWAETEPLAEAGLVAFAFTAYMPSVAPAGGRKNRSSAPTLCPSPGRAATARRPSSSIWRRRQWRGARS